MKQKKKLSPKQKQELKEKLKRISLGALHIICYILSALFILVCIVGGVQSCKGKPKQKQSENNVPQLRQNQRSLVSNRANNNYEPVFSIDNYAIGDRITLYYDFDNNDNFASGDVILNYVQRVNDYDYLSDYRMGDADGFNYVQLTPNMGNLILPDYYLAEHWTYGVNANNYHLVGIDIIYNDTNLISPGSLFLYGTFRYGTANTGAPFIMPVGYWSRLTDTFSFCTEGEIMTLTNGSFNLSHASPCRTLIRGAFNGGTFIIYKTGTSNIVHGRFYWLLKYFNLDMYHHFQVDFTDFYTRSLWRSFISGVEVIPNIFANDIMPRPIIIHGRFVYREQAYNTIYMSFIEFAEGTKINYPNRNNSAGGSYDFTYPNQTIPSAGFSYYFTFDKIYLRNYANYALGFDEDTYYYDSVLFYQNTAKSGTNILVNYADTMAYTHSSIGFVNKSYTTIAMFYDNGATFTFSNEAITFPLFVVNYLTYVNYFYFYITADGYISSKLPQQSANNNYDENYLSKVFNIFGFAYAGLVPLLTIQLLPGVSLGMIFFLPFFLIVILFVVRLFKR